MNPLLRSDSYKHSHPALFPEGITGMSAYIEARKPKEKVMLAGLQLHMNKWVHDVFPVTHVDVDQARDFLQAHGEPFSEEAWRYMVDRYGGMPPVHVRAVPEGLALSSGVPLVRIECIDPKLFWLAMFLETDLQRAVWYPSSVASQDHEHYHVIKKWWLRTCDNLNGMEFTLHDFGGRGVTCSEQAQIGGFAHLIHFNGSDTLEGVWTANTNYGEAMAAFSVPAAEHSIECSWGPYHAPEYLEHVLKTYARPGAIVSIVIDAYDTMREATLLCTKFKDLIIQSGARVVFRPDSGDPRIIVPDIMRMQAHAFGTTMNKRNYAQINHVGVIQGDGVDKDTIDQVLAATEAVGFSSNNLVFGSGGALLQKVNRDTYGFAQKASAIQRYGRWEGIYKDPITDAGKRSKAGRLETYRSRLTGEHLAINIDKDVSSEFEPIMRTVYLNGTLGEMDSLEAIRKRART